MIIFLVISVAALFFIVYLSITGRLSDNARANRRVSIPQATGPKKKSDNVPSGNVKLFETYDYYGTKIINENGIYTVRDKTGSQVFYSHEELPLAYKKMLSTMQNIGSENKKNAVSIDFRNNTYYVRTPDGKVRKYKRLSEIPARYRS